METISPTTQRRHWCFTVNDSSGLYSQQDFLEFSQISWCRYLVVSQELKNTLHWQGYLECKNNIRLSTIKNALPGQAHLELRMGTRDEARAYCMKTTDPTYIDGPWEFGTWNPAGQGSRTDLIVLANHIIEHGEMSAVMAYPHMAIRYPRGIQYLAGLCNYSTQLREVKCTLLYGPTGTGKSRFAYDKSPEAYRKNSSGKFFDFYMGQKTIVLDEFAGKMSKVELVLLLALLDIYPLIVDVKGASRSLLCTQWYVTTNVHPRLWYDWTRREGQFDALMRRFDTIYYVPTYLHYYRVDLVRFKNWSEFSDEMHIFDCVNNLMLLERHVVPDLVHSQHGSNTEDDFSLSTQ